MLSVGTAPGISASPSEDNMRYFNVMILGPTQTPYEGNKFNGILFNPVLNDFSVFVSTDIG